MGGGSRAAVKPLDEFPLDVTVEVYGLIFLYNPPNLEALGVEEITAETELSDGPEIVVDKAKVAAKAAVAAAEQTAAEQTTTGEIDPATGLPTNGVGAVAAGTQPGATTDPGAVGTDVGPAGVPVDPQAGGPQGVGGQPVDPGAVDPGAVNPGAVNSGAGEPGSDANPPAGQTVPAGGDVPIGDSVANPAGGPPVALGN